VLVTTLGFADELADAGYIGVAGLAEPCAGVGEQPVSPCHPRLSPGGLDPLRRDLGGGFHANRGRGLAHRREECGGTVQGERTDVRHGELPTHPEALADQLDRRSDVPVGQPELAAVAERDREAYRVLPGSRRIEIRLELVLPAVEPGECEGQETQPGRQTNGGLRVDERLCSRRKRVPPQVASRSGG
jgi:hypothetical protein